MSSRIPHRVRATLGWRWTPAVVIAAAVLLALPCTKSGFSTDDWIHSLRMTPDHGFGAYDHAPLDLFVFASGDPAEREASMELGQLSWWTADDFELAFWRPVSALTHMVDHALWPSSSRMMHLQGLAWFALLLVVLALLYRRFAAPWIAALALALFALDDAHGPVLSFIANRNALIAAVFAFAALLAHHRWRADADARAAVAAPALLGVGLLSGEVATGILGYLLAYALFLDRDRSARRLLTLVPASLVTAGYLAAHHLLGYGARGGGVYTHPFTEPLRFIEGVGERGPVLWLAQVVGLPSEAWPFYPPGVASFIHGFGVVVLVLSVVAVVPLLRRRPDVRFWLFGALLALVPVCATLPVDRNLLFVGVGAAGALASLLTSVLEGTGEGSWARAWRWGLLPVAILACLGHLVLAPLLLPLRAQTIRHVTEFYEGIDATVPSHESVQDRTLVVVNAPADGLLAYMPMRRHVLGIPHPARLRVLATGLDEVQVLRETPTSLRIRPTAGYWGGPLEQMVRGPSRPVEQGYTVVLSDLLVEVTDVTADGRAAEAVFRWEVPLEDPSLLWMRWEGRGLVPWRPPPRGTLEHLPAIDMGWGPEPDLPPSAL